MIDCVLKWTLKHARKYVLVQLDNDNRYDHISKSVETSREGTVAILWNQQVWTDKNYPNNKLDIVILDDKQGICMLRDVAIPGHRNVIKKRSQEDFKV